MTATADLPNKNIKTFTEKLSFAAGDKSIIVDSEDGDKIKLIAKSLMKGDDGDPGTPGTPGDDGNGIASITTNKVGKTTTVTITEDDATITNFDIEDGADGAGAGDVLASGTLTADKIILGDGTKTVKTSSKGIVTTLGADDTSVPTSKAVKDVTDGKQATMTKAAGSDVDTGTDDAKYVTSKTIADSKLSYTDGTETLTNKRINPRVTSAASYTTDTGTALTVANCDIFVVTAQAGALKLNNPGGTPTNGHKLIVRIKDNGTARALTYDTQFRAIGTALPSTTVISKTLYLGFIYNSDDTKRDLVASGQEA